MVLKENDRVLWTFDVSKHHVRTITEVLVPGEVFKLDRRFTVFSYELTRIEDDKGFQLSKGK